jgi:transcriptional regulator with XRE-family HTH domain
MANELGRRIRAACGYAGLGSTRSLAAKSGLDVETLRQIELGVVAPKNFDLEAVISAIAEVTGLPPGFFVADFQQLSDAFEPAHEKLDRLERRVEELTGRMEQLADRADEQLRVGSERLDEFAEVLRQSKDQA